ncbi:MAG: hypothetical protein JSS72_04050 [Armatimonadetes bacterium]|nr:hypothetical protein [Armatimonadota bacterium]
MRLKYTLSVLAVFSAGCMLVGENHDMQKYPLDSLTGLQLMGVTGSAETFKGKAAVRIGNHTEDLSRIALVTGSHLRNGTIEVDLAAQPIKGADPSVRGFAGLIFRAATDDTVLGGFSRYEYFYLRATNGRSTDPERSAHVVQYASFPNYPWERLRSEAPGRYEAHSADVDVAVWTHMTIQVHDRMAKFFIGSAKEPCLVVHDLKQDPADGSVGLWLGPQSEAWFANLVVKPE